MKIQIEGNTIITTQTTIIKDKDVGVDEVEGGIQIVTETGVMVTITETTIGT